jgi:hypothetical protein
MTSPHQLQANDAMSHSQYWVLQWLQDHHITSLQEANDLLPKYKVLDTLRQRATDFAAASQEPTVEGGPLILAGTGVDLWGGRMVCPGPSCLRNQVDTLLKHVWHYFDKVVVDDVLTPLLIEDWSGSKKDLIHRILHQLAPLLYLAEIGASDYVEFRPKNRCNAHWMRHAEEQGLTHLIESKDQLIADLISGAVFDRQTKPDGSVVYSMNCLDAGVGVSVLAEGRPEQELQAWLGEIVFQEYMIDLTADISAARGHGLPLGSVLAFPGRLLQMSRPASVADVVFQLQLPVLEGIPTRDLIAIRQKESEYFENFRTALRRAAQERISLVPSATSAAIADQVKTDIVDPELAKIKTRLAASESSLVRKVGVGLFLGAVATTCGILFPLSPAAALSAGTGTALTATAAAALKHLDTKEEVSLSDMYFLWKAAGHAH